MSNSPSIKNNHMIELEELRNKISNLESQDIEHKRVEGVLREDKLFAENIVNTVREPMVVLDEDLRILFANKSFFRIFQVNPKETVSRLLYEIGDRQWDIPKLRQLLEEILPQETYFDDFEVDHEFPSIGHRTMLLNARIIHEENSERSSILLAFEDITERKTIEEELKQKTKELERSNKDLQQFAYVASHDLQEPLRMISSFSQLLAKRYSGLMGEEADEFIDFILDGSTRMQALINNLLEYSRIETRGGEFESVETSSVADQVVRSLSSKSEECQAVITYDALPVVWGDFSQLIRLFQNLLTNSLKYRSDAAPEVYISAEFSDGEWLFCVRDNGIGIDPKYFERIFVIFKRLHGREEYDGSGMGLAICKRIVERHGGRIWVESQPGNGSTFYFTLQPANKEEGP